MSEAFARRYKLLDRLAVGGTAEVFRALFVGEHGDHRPVVIKRVLPQMARDERFRQLFHEEARVAAALAHPNIVRVLDFGVLGDTCYIALEPVDGQDLGRMLALSRSCGQRPGPVVSALVAVHVADALQFIHERADPRGLPLRIIHRDVSPQNILVAYRGDVKLTDFGIAKSAMRRDHTVDGTLRGKLEYMAPEQATAGSRIDHRADLFALGCVLYEMLHGSPPFRGASELETLDRLRAHETSVDVDHLEAPQPLRAIVARVLQRDPTARYPRAEAMATDLRAFLHSSAAGGRGQLRDWIAALRAARTAGGGQTGAVDDAVRALLGDPGDDEAPLPQLAPAGSTSVFSSRERLSTAQVPTSLPSDDSLLPADVEEVTDVKAAGVDPEPPWSRRPDVFDGPDSGPTPTKTAPEPARLAESAPATLSDPAPGAPPARAVPPPPPPPPVPPPVDSSAFERVGDRPRSGGAATGRRRAGVPPAPLGPLPGFGGVTARIPAPQRRRRLPAWWPAVPLLLLGVAGWILWMMERGGPEPNPTPTAKPAKTSDVRRSPPTRRAVVQRRWIRSDPKGATIVVDGRERGQTPAQVALPPGRFVIELRKAGYRTSKLELDAERLASGPLRIDLTARPRRRKHKPTARATATHRTAAERAGGYLTINSLPWSRVYLDGRYVGNTPILRRRVRTGRRVVQLRGPRGRIRKSFVAVVRRGQTRTFTFDLSR